MIHTSRHLAKGTPHERIEVSIVYEKEKGDTGIRFYAIESWNVEDQAKVERLNLLKATQGNIETDLARAASLENAVETLKERARKLVNQLNGGL